MRAPRERSIRRRRLVLLPAVALLTVVAACARGLGGPGTIAGSSAPVPKSPPAPGPRSDAPTQFAESGRVRLPEEAEGLPGRVLFGVARLPLPLALVGTTAYVATHAALLAVDLRSGRTVATIEPEHTPARTEPGWNPAGPPVLAELDGEPTVVVPLLVNVSVAGEAGPRTAVELVGVRPGANRRSWSVTVDIGTGAVPERPFDEQWLAVVGVVGTVAVLRVGRGTYGIDLVRGKQVWRESRFTGAAVVSDVVVGWLADGKAQRPAGLGAVDGRRRWADRTPSTRLSVTSGGPRFAVVQGLGARGRYLRIVEATTGRAEPLPAHVAAVVGESSMPDSDVMACRYDGAATTVCGAIWAQWNAGFDAATGQWLWEVRGDTKGRTPIRLTAAWHGAAYGTEEGTRPVVLDARTGAVRRRAAVAAPYVVNASVGVGPPVLGGGMYAFAAVD
jgi:hypothetical protein